MSGKKEIIIDFDEDTGKVTAEASGYSGEACSVDMNAIMKVVGETTKRVKKPSRDRTVARVQRT